MTALEIALCQYELDGAGSVGALTERADALLDRAGPADVYILPELFAVDATEPAGGDLPVLSAPAFDALREWCVEQASARDALVVGGSAYVDDGGPVNRCPIGTPEGEAVTYDKRRPVPGEREAGVEPGRDPPPIVEIDGVAVGVLVCYDVEFPSLVRATVDRGAEVLAVPSWTADEAGYQRVSRCSAARAVENQVAVAQASLVGEHPVDDVGSATGRSAVFAPCDDVVGPHGTRLTLPRDELAAATCGIDVDQLRTARESAAVRPYSDAEEFE